MKMYEGNVENTRRGRVFSTILECSQMSGGLSGVFYQNVNTRHSLRIVITCDWNTRKF